MSTEKQATLDDLNLAQQEVEVLLDGFEEASNTLPYIKPLQHQVQLIIDATHVLINDIKKEQSKLSLQK